MNLGILSFLMNCVIFLALYAKFSSILSVCPRFTVTSKNRICCAIQLYLEYHGEYFTTYLPFRRFQPKKKYKVKVTTRCTHNISICRRMSQNFDLSSSSSSRSSRSPEASKGLCKGNEPVKQENRQLSSGFMCEAE